MRNRITTRHYPEALEGLPFQTVGELCREEGFEAYVIGGYVRDYLLGTPGKDIDIVCVGEGPALAQRFAERTGARDVVIYRNFGTALVKIQDYEVEFVGARKESYSRHSRKPAVVPGTLHEDQLRRDFTINALSLSLNPQDWGQLKDPFDGLGDLQAGIIRTPTDPLTTFSDDPLRMMRAVRFATRLAFSLDEACFQAIQEQASRIEIVSQERITEELHKMLQTPTPSWGFKLLHQAGLLPLVLPELARMQGVEARDGIRHKDNFFHTLKVLDNVCAASDNVWLRWAALLHDIGKPKTKRFQEGAGWTFHGHEDVGAKMIPKLFKRLRLPQNEKMRYVQKLVRLHQRPIALADEEVTDSAIRRLVVEAGEDLDDLLALCRADITTRDPKRHRRYLQNYADLEERIHTVLERDALRNWQPPVDGQMIMDYFQIPPSKQVGEIKAAVRNAILDGEIPNDDAAAWAYMKRKGAELLGREPEEHEG